MTLPDDVVELFERHMKAPYRERLESCPYSFERSETGQMYRVASIEHAYQLFAAGYAARAALEAARYGEMRECLTDVRAMSCGSPYCRICKAMESRIDRALLSSIETRLERLQRD